MTRAQKFAPVIALFIVMLGIGWTLLPFEFAPGVGCGAPLLGAKPDSEETVGSVIPKEDCLEKGRRRLIVTAMLSVGVMGAAAAAVALQPISTQCLKGDHDSCGEWWGNMLGEGLGCQCECHAGDVY